MHHESHHSAVVVSVVFAHTRRPIRSAFAAACASLWYCASIPRALVCGGKTRITRRPSVIVRYAPCDTFVIVIDGVKDQTALAPRPRRIRQYSQPAMLRLSRFHATPLTKAA
jgi:hypothetical protein